MAQSDAAAISGKVRAMRLSRRSLIAAAAAVSIGAVLPRAFAAARPTITVYKGAT